MYRKKFFDNYYKILSFTLIATSFSIIIGSAISNLMLVLSILIYFSFNRNNFWGLLINIDIFTKIFLLFYIYILLTALISSNISDTYQHSLIKTFLFSKFIFFFIIFKKCVQNSKYFFDISLKYFVPIYFLIIFDAIVQYIYGYNLAGIKFQGSRLSGFFGDEWILGTFIYHVVPLVLISILFFKKISIPLKKILLSTIIILSYLIVYLSGERTIFLLSSIYFLIISLIYFNNKFYILASIIIIILLISLTSSKRIFNSYSFNLKDDDPEFIGTFTVYKDLYSTSIKMFNEKKFFGQGVQSFKKKCNDKSYLTGRFGCSSHPHNFYFQILAENGILGFILFLSLVLIILKDSFFSLVRWINAKDSMKYLAEVILAINILLSFLPLLPTGNFYSSVGGVLIFSKIAIYYGIKNLIYK